MYGKSYVCCCAASAEFSETSAPLLRLVKGSPAAKFAEEHGFSSPEAVAAVRALWSERVPAFHKHTADMSEMSQVNVFFMTAAQNWSRQSLHDPCVCDTTDTAHLGCFACRHNPDAPTPGAVLHYLLHEYRPKCLCRAPKCPGGKTKRWCSERARMMPHAGLCPSTIAQQLTMMGGQHNARAVEFLLLTTLVDVLRPTDYLVRTIPGMTERDGHFVAAVRLDNDAALPILMQHYRDHNEGRDPPLRKLKEGTSGLPLLHVAAKRASWRVVPLLAAAGCDVNEASVSGITPLMFACSEARPLGAEHRRNGFNRPDQTPGAPTRNETVEALLAAGADPHATCTVKEGGKLVRRTALLACVDGYLHRLHDMYVVDDAAYAPDQGFPARCTIAHNRARRALLLKAAADFEGTVDAVRALVARGVDINHCAPAAGGAPGIDHVLVRVVKAKTPAPALAAALVKLGAVLPAKGGSTGLTATELATARSHLDSLARRGEQGLQRHAHLARLQYTVKSPAENLDAAVDLACVVDEENLIKDVIAKIDAEAKAKE